MKIMTIFSRSGYSLPVFFRFSNWESSNLAYSKNKPVSNL